MKKTYDIILSGIGIGGFEHTTQETLSALKYARVIYHQTSFHHMLLEYCEKVISLDSCYFTGEVDEIVYKRIVEIIVKEAQKGPGVVVVEGHPTFYDDVSWDIFHRGRKLGLKVRIIPAISCIDALAAYCGLKISAVGFQIVEATSLVLSRQKLNPYMDTLVMQIGWFGTSLLCEIKRNKKGRFLPLIKYLSKFYPKTHKIRLLLAPSSKREKPKIIQTKLGLLDDHYKKNLSGMSLFIPALRYDDDYEIDEDFYHKTEDLEYLKTIAVIKRTGG